MKTSYNHRNCLILILWFISFLLYAQIGSFRNINSDGIVDFQANCFFKDSQGFIWTGGSYKVQRFDGKNFRIYDIPSGIEIINAITEDASGKLYFGASKGLYTLNINNTVLESVLPSLNSNTIYSLYIDRLQNIYAGTDDGLVILSKDTVQRIKVQSRDFPFDQIIAIEYISEQLMWLLTPGGIVAFNPLTKNYNCFSINTQTNKSYCTCMKRVDSTLFVGTNGEGIYAFNTKNNSIEPFINIGNGAITCLSVDASKMLYSGTKGTGVFIISTTTKRVTRNFNATPNIPQKLRSGMITTLLADNFGILWVGYSEQLGFDYMFLEPKPFMIFKTPTFSSYNLSINKFYLGDGFKLLTGLNSLYYISDSDGKAEIFRAGIGKGINLKPGKILTITPYKDKLLLGGESGIYQFNTSDSSLSEFAPLSTSSNATIYHMATNDDENLWIASSNGLSILDSKTNIIKTFTTTNSNIPDNLVRFFFFDSKQKIWVCTSKGLSFFDVKKQLFHSPKFSFPFIEKEDIHHIMEDKNGNFILCYNTRKVMLIDSSFTSAKPLCTEEEAGFTGLNILKTLQDKIGNYWFIGSRGAITANESLTNYEMYSISEGLYQPYASDGDFDKDGRLWLSNNGGFYYASGRFERLNATMAITDIKINGASKINELRQEIKNEKTILLNRDNNNLEFQFALLDYTRPDLMVYECWLEGADNWWTILRGIDKISYKDLTPGKYTFIVRHNMDKNSTRRVHFEIKPLFTKTGILFLIFLFALIIGLIYHFSRSKKRANLNIETIPKEAEKTEDRKYQHNKISNDKADEVIKRVIECMEVKRIYLNENLKMSDLAKEVDCSNQILSQVFNLFLNEKYNEFINRYRINEFKQIVSTSNYSKYTLKSLAQRSGFSSYTSFYRAFKEQTGTTPNEFIQNLEK